MSEPIDLEALRRRYPRIAELLQAEIARLDRVERFPPGRAPAIARERATL